MNPMEISSHKEAFLSEARTHIASMNHALLKLEKSPEDLAELHEILRAAHTLKSMAAAMDYSNVAKLCHAAEDVVTAIQQNETPLSLCVDILFESFDLLESMLDVILKNEPETDTNGLITRLQAVCVASGTTARRAPSLEDNNQSPPAFEPVRKVAVSIDKLDALLNLAEELLVERMRLDLIKEILNNPELSATVESVGRLIADLQYHVMQARMVPVGFVFSRFPRMVRDLARAQGKDIDLVMEGGDIELDRAMIDEIGECLVHLLRNAVDHGIETAQVRAQIGKSTRSTITLRATRDKQSALISIEDDGTGIDLESVRRAAIACGVLTADCTRAQIIKSIFNGVSTTAEVTSISGRGVGLNIVKRKAETIGGTITVETNPGKGSTFILAIPLTMAVIKTLFVGVGGRTYAIPVANIERLVSAEADDVKYALGQEAIVLDDEKITIKRLDQLFRCNASRLRQQPIVIVQKGGARIGLAVDSLKSTEEVVIKPLSGALRDNQFFAGSALIGSGEVVMVLEVGHLMGRGAERAFHRDGSADIRVNDAVIV